MESLGLSDEVIGIESKSGAARKRLILLKQKLVPLPSSFGDIFRKIDPFSKSMASILLKELLKPKFDLKEDEDISVFDFFSDRLGEEMAHFISDPLCRGITAGDSRKLSMKSLFPDIFHKTQAKGSLVKGMLSNSSNMSRNYRSPLVKKISDNKWSTWSFKKGLQTLPEKLTDYLKSHDNVELKTTSAIKRISFKKEEATISLTDGSKVVTDELFSCLPAHLLCSCLEIPLLKQKLNEIPFVDVAVAVLEFEGRVDLNAFGFLVPSFEGGPLLGITFDSSCFPQHDAGRDITRVTCMMGGDWFRQLFSAKSDDQILEEAVKSSREILGFKSDPTESTFKIHRKCISQYVLGHSKVVSEIKSLISECGVNVHLLGSSFEGISVNDVILNARKAVSRFESQNTT